ncbi:MAG: hypothetical protein E7240_07530 [Lachnospiraceae bacterium]|nr:hypothetical protein [Lachnospiraceae bacterium]
MVKSIEQLLSGRYEYSVTPPTVTPAGIDVTAEEGKDYRGSFLISSGDGQRLRGHGHVSNARIVLSHDRFTGKEFRVDFGIDTKGLRGGDVVEGEIILSLNAGEIHVPVRLAVNGGETVSSAGPIRSLDDFASLARIDVREAYRIFSSGSLYPVIRAGNESVAALYRAFSADPVTYQRLEEFLVASGSKEAVHFTADKNSEYFEHLTESAQGVLRITKNTWGNVNLTVQADEKYIALSQKHFVEDDFVGNTLDLTYVILYEELGDGVQRGTIRIDSDTDHLTLHITASRYTAARSEDRILRKKAVAGICHDAVDFCLGKTDGTTFAKRSIPRISSLRRFSGENLGLDLMEAAVYYLVGASRAASSILRKWEQHDFGEEAASFEAAYLYLTYELGLSGYTREELLSEIEALFAEDEESLIILVILARIDPQLAARPGRVLTAMGRMYRSGNRSPYLFMQAALTLRGNERLMNALTPFAEGILLFAVRQGVMDRDLALRTAVLSANEKTFSPILYRILSESYKQFPLDEILEALCRLIIKGNPRREAYHEWYALAIERDIRITRLFEYYMETLPENSRRPYPLKVRRYFTMNNTLGSGKKAMLFANIIRNKAYDPETFSDYTDQMSEFAREMIRRGAVNEDFAVVYTEFLPTLPTKEMAEAMASIMFRHSLVTDDVRAREVLVVHGALREEESYPIYRGRAYVDLYTDDAVILFKDEYGRRYRSGVQYALTKLIDYNTYIPICRRFGVRDAGLILHLCSRTGDPGRGDEGTLLEFMYAAFSDEFTEEFRSQTGGKLLEYFAAHRDSDYIDLFLSKIRPERIAASRHALLIEIMALRGMDREAFDAACRYGYEDIEPGLLGRLAGRMIEKKNYEFDEELILMAADAFRKGVLEQRILIYLCSFFEGALKDMCAVRTAAAKMDITTRVIDEKILQYAMLTRTPVPEGAEIIRRYASSGMSERVLEAYIHFEAQRSFMESEPLDESVAEKIEQAYDSGKTGWEICYLSLLRAYAARPMLTEDEKKREEEIFRDAVQSGYLFAFYSKLPVSLRQKYLMDDKMIIECRALPGDKVMIRTLDSGGQLLGELPMRRMTGGIFARAFTMFAGEILRYRTVIHRNGEIITGPEEACVMTMADQNGRSRYQRINRMIAEKKNGNYEAFRETERKYGMAVHAVRELFPIRTAGNDEEKKA